jgi:hypothetical protein
MVIHQARLMVEKSLDCGSLNSHRADRRSSGETFHDHQDATERCVNPAGDKSQAGKNHASSVAARECERSQYDRSRVPDLKPRASVVKSFEPRVCAASGNRTAGFYGAQL